MLDAVDWSGSDPFPSLPCFQFQFHDAGGEGQRTAEGERMMAE